MASHFIKSKIADYPHGHSQWAWQLAAIAGMLLAAIVSGAVAGLIVKVIDPAHQSLGEEGYFEDALFWEEVEEEGEKPEGGSAPPGESVAVARG